MTDEIKAMLSERGKTHGRFEDHARCTQRLKDVLHDEASQRMYRKQTALSMQQLESLEMILHKIGRIVAGDADFHDHWDDIAGYAKLCSKEKDQ